MKTLAGYCFGERLRETDRFALFRAQRDGEGGAAIVKTLLRENPDAWEIAVLRHEFDVSHPLEIEGVLRPVELMVGGSGIGLVYEDCPGRLLSALLAAGPIPIPDILGIGIHAAATLALIHQHDLMHKNVSPASLIILPSGSEIRLTDFSISSRLSRERGASSHPRALEGTLAYISPEQTGRMNRSIDYRTDLYSLGATLYEMLTGRAPFASDDAMELVHCHIARTPPAPSEQNLRVPIAVSRIVMKLLAKRAEDRYQSASGLKADLEECLLQWKAGGRVDLFKLGGRDVSVSLQIPEKLYGREQESATLLAAFDRAAAGGTELLLVSGYSGVGKSLLVHELHKPIVSRRGYFVSGKFDQFQRDVPYTALTQALTDLVRQILSGSAEEVAAWKARLLAALGESAEVIIELIPQLGLVVGPQPPVEPLSPVEEQIRFGALFRKFVAALATAEHPIAMFIDDLQWADTATLSLLQRIVTDSDIRHLLLMGAYRDNEVTVHHPLVMTLVEIRKTPARVNEISLAPLALPDLQALVQDSLGATAERSAPLAAMIQAKTLGNPFYVIQFMHALHEHGLLAFDAVSGDWLWELDRIEAEETTKNVVDLMIAKIRRLPAATQAALKLASCIGNRFDLATFASVSEKGPTEAARDLWQGVKQGLVLPVGDAYKFVGLEPAAPATPTAAAEPELGRPADAARVRYRFLHDRVQQAANQMIPEAERKALHLRIGRLLLKSLPEAERDERLLDIVNHLNVGAASIATAAERLELARLNLQAGKKAKLSSAYAPAVAYLRAGIGLLPPDAWTREFELAHALHMQAAEGEYMCQSVAAGEALCAIVVKRARTPLDQVKVCELRMQQFTTQGRMVEACDTALELLVKLGVELPKKVEKSHVQTAFVDMLTRTATKSTAELLAQAEMTEPHMLAAIGILARTCPPAYQCNPDLLAVLICKMMDITLRFGNSVSAAYAYTAWAVLIAGVVSDYVNGYAYSKLAIDTAHRFGVKKEIGRAIFHFNTFNRHWIDPQRSCVQPLIDVGPLLVEAGDLEFYAYTASFSPWLTLLGGEPLAVVRERAEQSFVNMEKLDLQHGVAYERALLHLTEKLTGLASSLSQSGGGGFDSEGAIQGYLAKKHLTAVFYTYLGEVIHAYLLGDYERAAAQAEKAEPHLPVVMAMLVLVPHNFYQSLALLAVARGQKGTADPQALSKVRENQKRLAQWAQAAACNCQHKHDLVEAELASVGGEDHRAEELFDRAAEGARGNGFPQDEALAKERAARHYLACGRAFPAAAYLRSATSVYAAWGAAAKVALLREEFPDVVSAEAAATRTRSPLAQASDQGGESLDLASILKAAQTISREVALDRLLSTLLRIVLQNAGAERGVLLLPVADEFHIQAEGRADADEIAVRQGIPLSQSEEIAQSVIQFVIRLRESVVLHDATAEARFAADPYIRSRKPASILCAPLLNQGKLNGVLYLENNLARGAFTAERLEVLGLLSGQIAQSIDNAALYESLEDKVRERTQQLEVRNKFIRDTFGRYLSDEIVSDLLEAPSGLKLGGESRQVTILMSDLRGFTSMAERLAPEQVVTLINIYLSVMTDVIVKHHGTIDEFIGDAILVVFGAPTARANDAERAVACAVDMQLAMATVNEQAVRAGLPAVEMGIGLSTGGVVVGNIGSQKRAKYGVVGSTVNLASRVESYTAGGQILISESTFREVGALLRIDGQMRVEPKGVHEPITIYDVGGIGGSYGLYLARASSELTTLAAEIPVEVSVVVGKDTTGNAFAGALVKLSEREAEVRLLEGGHERVAALANVKLRFGVGEGEKAPPPVYAKVLARDCGGADRMAVRFTSLPEESRAWLAARRG
ncbi:MAG: AAA family ATPase [Planctomycetes bacterium]|nr:AAA family ATPase [Planctomycetota bacterium]